MNHAAALRFELVVDGHTAHLDYQVAGDRLRLMHVEVPPEIRGHHCSDELIRAALEYAAQEHLHVVPICPAVRAFLGHHPEFMPVVDEHWTGTAS
ncbi:MAG: GNAT family N-acetyltransferase [Gemmatimonadales bacterium]